MTASRFPVRGLLTLPLLLLFGCSDSDSTTAPVQSVVASISVTPATATILANETQQFTATVSDQDGSVMTGQTVTWSSSDNTLVSIDPSGLATAELDGMATITGTIGTVAGSAALTIRPIADELAYISGSGQEAVSAMELPDSLVVRVVDRHGNGSEGVAVVFAAIEGGGTLSPDSVTTDSTGYAKTQWVLGPTAGEQVAEARADGLGGSPLEFSATAHAGAPASVEIMPASIRLTLPGAAVQTEAVARDTHGNVAEATFLWSSLDPGIATVDGTGLVNAIGEGATHIVVESGELSDTASVVVVPAEEVEILAETITAGGAHSCGLDQDGHAYCWGSNAYGQLGDGTDTDRHTPTAVIMPPGVTFASITAGDVHNVALTPTGHAYAWGRNDRGQLGDGTTTNRDQPVGVTMPAEVSFTSISAGWAHSVAISSEGEAYGWGENEAGRLGDGGGANRTTPVAATMPAGVSFVSITAGGSHTAALTTTGRVFAWGNNFRGPIGDGSYTNRPTPVEAHLPTDLTFASVSADGQYTVALSTTGIAYAWGDNLSGELGDGSLVERRNTPGPVSMPEDVSFASLGAGGSHVMALSPEGDAFGWGHNRQGALGVGSTVFFYRTPVPVAMPEGVSFASIVGGGLHTVAVTTTGNAYAWGFNHAGQLGDGSTDNSHTPILVSGGIVFR